MMEFLFIFVTLYLCTIFCPSNTMFRYGVDIFFPWAGLLRVRFDAKKQAISQIVLIKEKIAVANAMEVAEQDMDLVKMVSRAMFFDANHKPNYFKVSHYIVHPEYDSKIRQNTIAMLFMEENEYDFNWKPVNWPSDITLSSSSVYKVGFTDRHKILEQTITGMIPVTEINCKKFYMKEKLDYKSLRPTYYSCYREMISTTTCVYDAGSALVTNYTGQWVLLGLGVYGPGCSLPSRFIDFTPYKAWINMTVLPINRRSWWSTIDGPTFDFRNESIQDFNLDKDLYVLSKINNETVQLQPATDTSETPEKRPKNCKARYPTLMYRESGQIEAPKQVGKGVLALGLGVYGPGCSLPSRFIDFTPYKAWINMTVLPINRRSWWSTIDGPTFDFRNESIQDFNLDKDLYVLSKINNETVQLQPATDTSETPEKRPKNCKARYPTLMYRESGQIEAPKQVGKGVLAISAIDVGYVKPFCLEVNIKCNKRSPLIFEKDKGFMVYNLLSFVNVNEIQIRGENETDKIKKVWYLIDPFTYDASEIYSLIIKFEFIGIAKTDIMWYGNLRAAVEAPTFTKPTSTTRKTPHGFDIIKGATKWRRFYDWTTKSSRFVARV